MVMVVLITLSTLAMGACTTIPARFIKAPEISEDAGYFIEAEDAEGFFLEVYYESNSFFPNPDNNIQGTRSYYVTIAQMIAQKRSKAIEPIVKSQLVTNTTRNEISGVYTSYVSGRVKYAR